MKTKQVRLTEKEQLAVLTMVSIEIQSNKETEELGIEPVLGTETLKALYKKLTGVEWEEGQA